MTLWSKARRLPLAGLAVAALLASAAQSARADPGDKASAATFWDLKLGSHARQLPPSDYVDYACGTNGGPVATLLRDWTEYAKCPPEPGTGYHEVQFRYDDEAEYLARATAGGAEVPAIYGSRFYDIAVVVSGLFDDDGFLVGLRAFTDPRVPDDQRAQAISLRSFLMNRFGPDGWACQNAPLAAGEQPIAGLSYKEKCDKTVGDTAYHVESNFFRKSGQNAIDPRTGVALSGQFRSDVRLEMTLAAGIDNRPARLAAIAATPRTPTEAEVNRMKAIDCPGCDLTGINLKRQDLRGAKLAGAKLANADLHAANLQGADLTGADLSGAVLNRADLRRVKLAKANLTGAEFFAAIMDGADLSDSDLTNARMGTAQLTRTNLERATLVAIDMTKARLLDTDLKGAEIRGTWLRSAQMNRADMTGANLNEVDFTEATLTGANFSDATIVQTDFLGANLRDANLSRANISASRLTSANLSNVNREGTVFDNVIDAP